MILSITHGPTQVHTPDGNIQKSELSEVTDITKVGKYVVAVELKA